MHATTRTGSFPISTPSTHGPTASPRRPTTPPDSALLIEAAEPEDGPTAARTTGPPTASTSFADECRQLVERVGCAADRRARDAASAPARPADRRGDAGAPRRPAATRAGWSSTTCSCSPATCFAAPHTARPCGRPCSSGTGGCCSTSSRTPIRSRSSWPPASPAARNADAADWARRRRAGRQPVRRRRPEAVHLPVPPRRHRHVPAGRSRQIGEPGRAGDQLPHRRTGAALGQPRVRQAHHRPNRDRSPDTSR